MARAQRMTLVKGNRGLLFLAIGAGLVAAVVVFIAISNSGSDGGGSTAVPTMVKTVVAARDIPAGRQITADMVEVKEIPESLVIRGAYSDSQILVGEAASTAIARGEQITPAKIGAVVPDKGIPWVVPPGKRGIAISVREVTAVGGLLLPGDKVDILAAIREKDSPDAQVERLRVTTILQNVEVLSVAQEAQEPAPKPKEGAGAEDTALTTTSGRVPEDPDNQPRATTVTVALDPGQVQMLVAMQEIAQNVWLSARPFGEEATPALEPVVLPIFE